MRIEGKVFFSGQKLVLYATFFGVWRRYGLTVEDFNLAHRIVQPIFRTQSSHVLYGFPESDSC